MSQKEKGEEPEDIRPVHGWQKTGEGCTDIRETDGAMKYNNEIMLLADLHRPLCPSQKQEGGPWFQLPTVDVQALRGHLQQHELTVQKLLGLQHLGLL